MLNQETSPAEFQALKKKIKDKGYNCLNLYYSGQKLMGVERPLTKPLIRGFYSDSPDTLLGVFKIPKPMIETKFGITRGELYELRPLVKNYFDGHYKCLEMIFASEPDNNIHQEMYDILLDDIPFPLHNLYKRTNNKITNLDKSLSYPSDFLPVLQELSVLRDIADAGFPDFKIKDDFFYTDFLDYHNDYAEFDRAYNAELINFINKRKEEVKELIYNNKDRMIMDDDYNRIDNYIIRKRLDYYE